MSRRKEAVKRLAKHERLGCETSDRSTWLRRTDKPQVVITDKQLDSLILEALDVLRTQDDLYVMGGVPVRFERDERGCGRIRALDKNAMVGQLAVAADWFVKAHDGILRAVDPPTDVAGQLLTIPPSTLPLRHLRTLSAVPLVRPDGSIAQKPGYDSSTRTIYCPPPGFTLPPVPDRPSSEAVRKALAALMDLLHDFPFEDGPSRANALGMLITPFVLSIVRRPRPLAVVSARVMGTGKTLLAELCSILATGTVGDLYAPPSDDEEFRKQITTILLKAPSMVIWDNLDNVLQSGALAQVLTAESWADRLLGGNQSVRLEPACAWIVTGRNVRLGGDMPRRCYWVRLDARMEKPYLRLRSTFKYPDIKRHAMENRAILIAALLTLIRAWFASGAPTPSTPFMGSFEEWSRVVGGVVEHAGVSGFLGNLNEMLDEADSDTQEMATFLYYLHTEFKGQPFSSTDVRSFLAKGDDNARNYVPNDLQDVLQVNGKFQMKLGWQFRKYEGHPFGTDGLRIVKAGEKQGANLWKFEKSTKADK